MTEVGAPEVSEDAILGGRVRLRQPRHGYRAAIDPILLAAAVPGRPGQRILDVGMGVGAASLCLWARVPRCSVTGLELQPDLAALARTNVALNGADRSIAVVQGDLLDSPELGEHEFDAVMTNPPYLEAGKATPSAQPGRARTDMEAGATLRTWIAFCCRHARPGGHVVLIHRADRLDGALAALSDAGCGGITIVPFWPKVGRAAKRVLLAARTQRSAPLVLAPGLVLHEHDGTYTPAAQRVLRHGEALPAAASLAPSGAAPI